MLDVRACLEVLRQGFTAPSAAIDPQRIRTDLPGPGSATVLLPGLVPGIPAYSVKVNAKFPRSRPALRGVVCLHDTGTGELLAMLDSATVTAWRTGLAAALATDVLARAEVRTVAVIGAGAQSDLVLRGLAALRSWQHLGADEPGKAELSSGLLTAARVFVDDVPLALTSDALGTAGLPARRPQAR